jgi:hypothetical protein
MSDDSRSRLARELMTALKVDHERSMRHRALNEQLDAADEFDRQERMQDLTSGNMPARPGGRFNEGISAVARGENQAKDSLGLAAHQKRDNRRFTDPVLRVGIFHDSYQTVDWSLGGLMVGNYVGELKSNNRFQITFTVASAKAGSAYYAAQVRVVRVDTRKRTLSLKFEKLAAGAFDFLSGLQLQQARKRTS